MGSRFPHLNHDPLLKNVGTAVAASLLLYYLTPVRRLSKATHSTWTP